MATKRQSQRKQSQRSTRAQRRAQERVEVRHSPKAGAGLRNPSAIGSIISVLVVAVILGVGIWRNSASTGSTASKGGLTDVAALSPAANQLPVGTKAPNFTLTDTAGRTYSLAAQHGHPVLLEFFAVWCPVCQGEAPIMAKITQTYVPKGVRVWSILANPYGKDYEHSGGTDLRLATKSDLSWFARQFSVSHPQLVDPHFKSVNKYGISAYPGLYVIDPTGKITFSSDGHHSYGELSKALDAALKVAH